MHSRVYLSVSVCICLRLCVRVSRVPSMHSCMCVRVSRCIQSVCACMCVCSVFLLELTRLVLRSNKRRGQPCRSRAIGRECIVLARRPPRSVVPPLIGVSRNPESVCVYVCVCVSRGEIARTGMDRSGRASARVQTSLNSTGRGYGGERYAAQTKTGLPKRRRGRDSGQGLKYVRRESRAKLFRLVLDEKRV